MKLLGLPKLGKTEELKTHPALACLFGYSRAAVEKISEKIKAKGFDQTEPVIYGRIDSPEGSTEEGIVDGYQRCAGAKLAALLEVWVQEIQFDCLQEAIEFAMSRHRLRRKAGEGEILYALCAREHLLAQHGGKRWRKEGGKSKYEDPNLISGVTLKMWDTLDRVTHRQISELYGVPKHTVDHVRSKYFRHLTSEQKEDIREKKIDAYDLVEEWDPAKYGAPQKTSEPQRPDTAESKPEDVSEEKAETAEGSEFSEDAVAEELQAEPLALLDWIPVSPAYKEEIRQAAEAAGATVNELIAQWICEKIEASAKGKPVDGHGSTQDENPEHGGD